MTTAMIEINENDHEKGITNLHQVRGLLGLLLADGDNGGGFSDTCDALQAIYASKQMLSEALGLIDGTRVEKKND